MSRLLILGVWLGVVFLTLVGLAGAIFRGIFPDDYVTRAEPARQRLLATLDRSDPPGIDRASELHRFDSRFAEHRLITLLHIVPGGVFLLFAPLQFSLRVRRRFIRFHRWSGRILIVLGLATVVPGLFFGLLMPYAGAGEAILIAVVSALFLTAVTRAILAVRRGDILRHREWMIRAFAVMIGISTTRVAGGLLDVALAPYGLGSEGLFLLALWGGWALTIGPAEVWIRYTRARLHGSVLSSRQEITSPSATRGPAVVLQ